jgi:hypothetical protein
MPVPLFIKWRTGDGNLDRIADSARATTEWLRANPIVDGVLFENQSLASGASGNNIAHTLGRAYRGYLICRNTLSTLTHCDQTSGVDTSLYINIRVSGATTCSIWVF